jgi:hypothetical protein
VRIFAVHATALAAFAFVTSRITGGHFSAFSQPALWTLGWFLTGAATLISWALVFLPATAWLTAVRIARSGLIWGVGVGVAVWARRFMRPANCGFPLARWTFAVVDWMLGLFYDTTCATCRNS